MEVAGWVAGKNVTFESRFAGGDVEFMRKYAAELVALSPDVILAQSTPTTTFLMRATRSIPIVFVNVTDPVEAGLVASLARPGGNITGFSNFEYAMGGKWLELLRGLSPAINHVLVLVNERNQSNPKFFRAIEEAAPPLGIRVTRASIDSAAVIKQAIDSFSIGPDRGLIVPPDNLTTANRDLIVALAAQHGLPAVYVWPPFARAGGLTSYGIDVAHVMRQSASYVDRILRGARPTDLPVQAPTKFEFVINVKTARALGLTVPPMLLALADEVIE
jgi:putative ABC transport system substrate-binding protein